MRLVWCAGMASALTLLSFVASAEVRVQVSGAVARPGPQVLADGSRLAAAAVASQPLGNAYPLGAAVLRPALQPVQRALKAGLLYDLDAVASAPGVSPALAARAHALREWIATMPATGRVRADLQPRRLEADNGSNRVLEEGDHLVYPQRPQSVRVVGAVIVPCELPHVALRDAVRYMRDCAIEHAVADSESLWVVQPDGQVQHLGIANWNRSPVQALAPGAVLYVPLDEAQITASAPDLNEAFAEFLATQPLPVGAP